MMTTGTIRQDFSPDKDPHALYAFIESGKWGLVTLSGEVLLPAQYDSILETRSNDGYYLIVNDYFVEFHKKKYKRQHIGLVNSKGEVLITPKYYSFDLSYDNRFATVRDDNLRYGVIDLQERVIIPFGKYKYIDVFCYGLSRVARQLINGNSTKDLWGIVDTSGTEVLPVIYDKVWNFKVKGRVDTLIFKDQIVKRFVLASHVIVDCPDSIVQELNKREEAKRNSAIISVKPSECDYLKPIQILNIDSKKL